MTEGGPGGAALGGIEAIWIATSRQGLGTRRGLDLSSAVGGPACRTGSHVRARQLRRGGATRAISVGRRRQMTTCPTQFDSLGSTNTAEGAFPSNLDSRERRWRLRLQIVYCSVVLGLGSLPIARLA